MNDLNILLEQYKLFVEMADRVSNRRASMNKFYVSLLAGLFAILSITNSIEQNKLYTLTILAITSFLGLALCAIWWLNLLSSKQLNNAKWKVIHEIESQLPAQPWGKEWEYLGHGNSYKEYLKSTTIERLIPAALSLPYLALLVYSSFSLFTRIGSHTP